MLFEELLDDPHERVVVLGSVHLRHKRSSLLQVLRRDFESVQSYLVLLVGVFFVGSTDVRSTVAQNNVRLYAVFFGNNSRRIRGGSKLESWHLPLLLLSRVYSVTWCTAAAAAVQR